MNQQIKQLLITESDNKHLEKVKAEYRKLNAQPIGLMSEKQKLTHREETRVVYAKLKLFVKGGLGK